MTSTSNGLRFIGADNIRVIQSRAAHEMPIPEVQEEHMVPDVDPVAAGYSGLRITTIPAEAEQELDRLYELRCIYDARGDKAEAMAVDWRIVERYERYLAPDHPCIAYALKDLGNCQNSHFDYESLAWRAYDIIARHSGRRNRRADHIIYNLVSGRMDTEHGPGNPVADPAGAALRNMPMKHVEGIAWTPTIH